MSIMISFIVNYLLPFLVLSFVIIGSIYFYIDSRIISSKAKNGHTQGGSAFRNNRCYFGAKGNKVKKNVFPYRDIPCNGDIFRAFWIIYNYDLGSRDENFFGALILKWIHDGNVKLEKDTNNIIFVNKPINCSEIEKKMFHYMCQASRYGGNSNDNSSITLERSEFIKWCESNTDKILYWFSDVLDLEIKKMVKEGKIIPIKVKQSRSYTLAYKVDDSMMEEAEKLAGLKKFLEEFSVIKNREPIEIELFNQYLIFAQLFGIADKVDKRFHELYPDFIQTVIIKDTDINFADSFNISFVDF